MKFTFVPIFYIIIVLQIHSAENFVVQFYMIDYSVFYMTQIGLHFCLTLLHFRKAKIEYSFGLSESNRVDMFIAFLVLCCAV